MTSLKCGKKWHTSREASVSLMFLHSFFFVSLFVCFFYHGLIKLTRKIIKLKTKVSNENCRFCLQCSGY